MDHVAIARAHYAEEIRLAGCIEDDRVVQAFASVPRERYLGPGPWQIPWRPRDPSGPSGYHTTRSADPSELYHNVLVAIDPARQLHNGLPSFLALKIEAAGIQSGDRVVHVGCGLGYYTAIMAELAAPGEVVAIEADPELAARARANLSHLPQVEVVGGDGTAHDAGDADVFFVNAGATHPAAIWVERLRPGGRMILPLTTSAGGSWSGGIVLLVERDRDADTPLAARMISTIAVFDCVGGRSDEAEAALRAALSRGGVRKIRSLRRADHVEAPTCWAHLGGWCLERSA